MAKWKEPTTEVALTDVDPRARMKEIRAEVKAFLKGDTLGLAHLGDLPSNMDDARRVIIATQDLLELEREKHRKATNHICELVHLLNGAAMQLDTEASVIQSQEIRIHQLIARVEAAEKHIYAQRDDLRQTSQERDAVLTTMKLLNAQPASMSMTMGHSNKDRG